MLGVMTLMPSVCFAFSSADSTVLQHLWEYRRNYTAPFDGQQQNVYMRYGFDIDKRNALLFLVPTMYVIAKGDHNYVGESYCKVQFRDKYDNRITRQVVWGTIPRQRTAMDYMVEFSTPRFYDVTLYRDYMLSPFHRDNRRYYHYKMTPNADGTTLLSFKPRTANTQLIQGEATLDSTTGRLMTVIFEGEYDMITFSVKADMNQSDPHIALPKQCSTNARFSLLGNKVTANYLCVYDCPQTLPDSLDEKEDKALMDSLRPVPLNAHEQQIYDRYDEEILKSQEFAHIPSPAVPRKNWLKDIGWDIIGYNLIRGNRTQMGNVSMRISPLLNPLYFGYSQSRGISYKLKLGLQYNWNAHRFLTFNPQIGYNFKLHQFYYKTPLRMNYNPKRNGYAELSFSNGNRISNASLADAFHKVMGDSIEMPEYKDESIQAINNVVAFDWLEIATGLVYHHRYSTNRALMREADMPDVFRSFSPMMTLRLTPWHKGPVLTANYEIGIKDILHSNLKYQRWEFDASILHRMSSLKRLSLRGGLGLYTERNSDYFVDYLNFRDNNLPTGWDDDWSGQFQLLDSRWYNESDYYVRGHMTYDTPMLAVAYLPLIGRYIEAERLYLSALSIEHTRPYIEVGYGCTNRIFSGGIFASFLGGKFLELECKITIELFNRW